MSKETHIHRCQFEQMHYLAKQLIKGQIPEVLMAEVLNPEGSCQEVCIMQAVLNFFLKAHVNKNDLTVIYSALQQLCTAN